MQTLVSPTFGRFSLSTEDSLLNIPKPRIRLVGFLLQHQVDAAGFGRTPQVLPFVQLGDNLLYRSRHGLETPLSAAVNVVGAFKRDHIAIPVGAFPTGRRLRSPDRCDLIGLFYC